MLKVMVAVAAVVIPYLFIGAIFAFATYSNDNDSSIYLREFVYYMTYLFCDATGLLVVMVAYPAIAIKLYLQHRQIRPGNATAVLSAGNKAVANVNPAPTSQNKQNENMATKHAKALKLYLAILALYLGSFIPMTLILALDAPVFAYGPYLNHVCNVFIYCVMIKSFREQSKEIFRKILSKFVTVNLN